MSLKVGNKEIVSQLNNVKKSAATQSENVSIYTAACGSSKRNSDIESYKNCIRICEEQKKELVEKLNKGNFSQLDKEEATEAKHPIAMGIGYAGMAISGLGLSAAAVCFFEPYTLVGGLAAGVVGAAIAGVAKGIIVNGDVKNTTEEDIRNYIQSKIDKIDKEIANYEEKIKRLEAKCL